MSTFLHIYLVKTSTLGANLGRQQESAASWHFLRKLSQEKYHQPLPEKLSLNPHGKPLSPLLGFHFNLSHCPGWLAIAFSSVEVGIDIEQKYRAISEKILARYGSVVGIPTSDFLKHWCLKESYAKATGKGLSAELKNLHFDLNKKELVASPKNFIGAFYFKEMAEVFLSVCTIQACNDVKFYESMEGSPFGEKPIELCEIISKDKH